MLVIAGPGSGKTLVITHRILNLIHEKKVNPQNILVITFTKAAALEMQNRFYALAGKDNPGDFYPVTFGTCHAIFFQIIKLVKDIQAKDILKAYEKCSMMEEILSDALNVMQSQFTPSMELAQKILSEISKVKNTGLDYQKWESAYCSQAEFIFLYESYQKECTRQGKIDFDDMLLLCLELLRTKKSLLEKCRSMFTYILVDEFQDINAVQYEIIKLLGAKHQNVFVVGDDDQSIYGFRGASPQIMSKFLADFPGAQKVELVKNYRCKQEIVDTSVRLINHNSNRFLKKFEAIPSNRHSVRYISSMNRRQQFERVALCIQEYMKEEGHHYEDVAVLFRTNGHASMLVEQLSLLGIPFQCREKLENIYDTSIAKDLIAYIRFALNRNQAADFFRIMNKPGRYIKRNAIPVHPFRGDMLLQDIRDKNVLQSVSHMLKQLDFIKRFEPFAAINYIRKGIGYEQYVIEYARHFHLDVQEQLDILEEISQSAKNFRTLKHWLEFVTTYEETMEQGYQNQKGIHIKTMHGAKGLEWPVVILPDLNEGNMPYKKAQTPEQIEEERRIFYVAMTRAREYLFFFYVKKEEADLIGLPSRFLQECLRL